MGQHSGPGSFKELWQYLQDEVFYTSPSADLDKPVFNPYSECDSAFDLPSAGGLRRQNLFNYLDSFPERPDTIVIGEAFGWRGGRFSGVPFTSEALLCSGVLPFRGACSSRCPKPYAEISATIFWKVMRPYHPHFLAWNCIPYHLHRPEKMLSNRSPSSQEILRFQGLLAGLLSVLKPSRVIAVGRCAEKALASLGLQPLSVRHPSHGGATDFKSGIENALRNLCL